MLADITESGFPGEVLAQFQKREIIGTAIVRELEKKKKREIIFNDH